MAVQTAQNYAKSAWTVTASAFDTTVKTASPYVSRGVNLTVSTAQKTWTVLTDWAHILAVKGLEGIQFVGSALVKTAQVAAQYFSQFAQVTLEFCKNNTRDLSFVALGALACGAIIYIASKVLSKKPEQPVVIVPTQGPALVV